LRHSNAIAHKVILAKERSPNNNCKGGLVIVLVIPQDGLSENSSSELEISIFELEVLDFEVEDSSSELRADSIS
jgi:hypothetical protein